MISFAVQKIILQRKEKISKLYKILSKTISSDSIISIESQIKEQEKDLDYFKKMEVAH